MDIDKNNTYQRCVCNWCAHKNECTKDKFSTTNIMGKVSMKCLNYKYNKSPE